MISVTVFLFLDHYETLLGSRSELFLLACVFTLNFRNAIVEGLHCLYPAPVLVAPLFFSKKGGSGQILTMLYEMSAIYSPNVNKQVNAHQA